MNITLAKLSSNFLHREKGQAVSQQVENIHYGLRT